MKFDKKTAIIILVILEASYLISLIPKGGTPHESTKTTNSTIFFKELDPNEEIGYLRNGYTVVKLFYRQEKPSYIYSLYNDFNDQLVIEVIKSDENKAYIFNGYTGYEKEIDTYNYTTIVSELCKAVLRRPPICLTEILNS